MFDELNAATVKYYPNPTNGILFIELSSVNVNEATIVNITNASGAVVNQYKIASISGNKIQIDLSVMQKEHILYRFERQHSTVHSVLY